MAQQSGSALWLVWLPFSCDGVQSGLPKASSWGPTGVLPAAKALATKANTTRQARAAGRHASICFLTGFAPITMKRTLAWCVLLRHDRVAVLDCHAVSGAISAS